MSIWNPFNTSSNSSSTIPWQPLTAVEQLAPLTAASHEKPVVIFKHSTRCGISAMVLHRMEQEWGLEPGLVHMYFLDLIAHRPVSNEVADRFGVPHQSPQLILIKEGRVTYHTSHMAISTQELVGQL